MVTNKRRWHFWACFEGIAIKDRGAAEIRALKIKGFKAKRWAPLLKHLWSGHFHVVVLCTFDELCKLAGIPNRRHKK